MKKSAKDCTEKIFLWQIIVFGQFSKVCSSGVILSNFMCQLTWSQLLNALDHAIGKTII